MARTHIYVLTTKLVPPELSYVMADPIVQKKEGFQVQVLDAQWIT